jgi:NAD(P)-dependent dehydrogenase (short-subunit alcohol dehydrogenase family)
LTWAIEKIRSTVHASTSKPLGKLHFIPIDLADLTTISLAIGKFLAAESRLDVLFNNAGRANMPLNYKTIQGLEPHFGINFCWNLAQYSPSDTHLIRNCKNFPAKQRTHHLDSFSPS